MFAKAFEPDPPLAARVFTDGGGGTTSLAPKIFPIRLLTSDPLPDCDGGGGTTVRVGSGTFPPASRARSGDIFAEGGGATTEVAGIVSFAIRSELLSGADTGGGMTDGFAIRTGAPDISRLTPPGAGGITLPASAGAERDRLFATLGAGATTEESRLGATDVRSRDTRGAGATTVGTNAGAYSVWSFCTLGAGGIRVVLNVGEVIVRSRVTFGAGAITDSSCTPLRV